MLRVENKPIMPRVIMLSVENKPIMLSVIMLSVIMLNVVMVSVVAPIGYKLSFLPDLCVLYPDTSLV